MSSLIPIDKNSYRDTNVYKSQLIQSAIMTQEIEPISNVYFDLMCLKDFKLGALLSFIFENKNEKHYKYLITRLSEYNKRIDRELIKYFPDLPYTEKMVEDRLHDKTYQDKVFALSPTTACYENLHHIIYYIKKHNDHTDHQHALKLVINIYPFEISDMIKNMFYNLIKSLSTTFKLGFINKPLKYISSSTLFNLSSGGLTFKLMFVWDVWDSFFAEDSVLKIPFTNDMFLQQAHIFSPRILQIPLDKNETIAEADHTFELMHNYLNICCQFDYLSFFIPTENEKQ